MGTAHWAGFPKKTERAWDCLKLHEVSVDEPLWGCLAVVHWHGTARKPLTSVMFIFCLCNIYSSNADNWKYLDWWILPTVQPQWRCYTLAWNCLKTSDISVRLLTIQMLFFLGTEYMLTNNLILYHPFLSPFQFCCWKKLISSICVFDMLQRRHT